MVANTIPRPPPGLRTNILPEDDFKKKKYIMKLVDDCEYHRQRATRLEIVCKIAIGIALPSFFAALFLFLAR